MSFIFIDTETTGLDPYNRIDPDRILEFGIAQYDSRLQLMWRKSWLVGDMMTERKFKEELANNTFVGKMHKESGLAPEWMAAYSTPRMISVNQLPDAVRQLLTSEHIFDYETLKTMPICGSSVHFDRMFMRRWTPEIDNLFSYRIIDVSSFKETIRVMWPAGYAQLEKDEENNPSQHRVLPDIQDSVNLFRKCLAFWEEMYPTIRGTLS